MAADAPERLEVGRVGKPHGLRGDVTVVMLTDREERTTPGARLFADDREVEVQTARRQRQGWVIHFAGVDDRDAAEALRGAVLRAEPLPALDDELYPDDLLGCEVRDRAGTSFGTVTAIEANPAHDLLVLDGGALVPMVFVVEHSPGTVIIDPPAGLFDESD
jgi:16S rRNA processing protein RimM